jgi:hypothetical protein
MARILVVLICSLHHIEEMNAYRADHMCSMIQLKNSWADYDKIWYGCSDTGGYPSAA